MSIVNPLLLSVQTIRTKLQETAKQIWAGALQLCKTGMCWWKLQVIKQAQLAQLVEHKTLNLKVLGSSPMLGIGFLISIVADDRLRSSNRLDIRKDSL